MAKPSSPSRAPRNAPQPKVHQYIGALIGDDFGRLSTLTARTAHAFAKKKLDTASQSLQFRTERNEKKARQTEAREYRAAERGLQAELRESDRRIALMWRALKTKVRPEKKMRHAPPKERKRLWPYASVALPKYDSPILDRRGQRGVFVRMRYYSRRTAEQGVSLRVTKYVWNGAALDASGKPYEFSNVGLTIDETMCAFDHLEQVNWSAAKNAKLLMHGIFAVDYRQTPDQMMECGKRWAEETLGRFDLPYFVTLHAPPPDGDQRNWHLHILWSTRPLVRTGNHDWAVGEMLRTDLDNPAAMKLFREMYAAVMTEVAFEAGQDQVYTAKSNAARGLVHEPQIHLSAADTNRARSGEHVAANEENHERVQRSKAAVLDDDLRHVDEALARQQDAARAIGACWARLPSLPVRVPERVVASTISANFPKTAALLPRCPASIAIPPVAPRLRSDPAQLAESLATRPELERGLPRAPVVIVPVAALPLRPSEPSRLKIANLRIQPIPAARSVVVLQTAPPLARIARSVTVRVPAAGIAPLARAPVGIEPSVNVPKRRAHVTVLAVPTLDAIVMPRAAAMMTVAVSVPKVPQRVSTAPIALSTAPHSPLPRFAGFEGIDLAIRRAQDARRHNDERLEQERVHADRVRHQAAERAEDDERSRFALHRLFIAIIEERHYVTVANDRRVVDASLLARFGVSPEEVLQKQAQERLAEIAQRQAGEISRIGTYLRDAPGDVRRDGSHWVLDETAPADVRGLVVAWRNDRRVQDALARIASTTPEPAAPRDEAKIVNAEPGVGWRRARQSRQRAMADGDEMERLDEAAMPRPGERMIRPGTTPGVRPVRIRQRFPGMPGLGLGD